MSETYRALLIGNSTFPNDSQNLQPLEGPVNDVALLRDALTNPETGMFEPGNVRMVPERTMSEILIELETFFSSASRDDRLLLYYSGHGLLTLDNQLLLCARDTRTDVARATAVSAGVINMMIESSSATGTVIMLDCCYSGSFKSGALPDSLRGSGRFLLTSTRSGQLANDADRRNGTSLFTQFVVDGLQGGAQDRDGDGFIVLDELYDYVYTRLRDGGRQLPQRNFSGHGDLAIARRSTRVVAPSPVTPPPPPPPPSAPETVPTPGDESPPAGAPAAAPAAAKRAEPERPAPASGSEPRSGRRVRLPVNRKVVAGLGALLLIIVAAVVALSGGEDGPELGPARLADPRQIAVGPDGSLYIVDAGSNRLLRRDPRGTIETVASSGIRVWPADGSAPTESNLDGMQAVAVDANGEVVFSADGTILRRGRDGQVRGVPFNVLGNSYVFVEALAFDPDGNILAAVGDEFATAILRVLPDGSTVNVAGAGIGSFTGDGGPATAARFKAVGIAFDRLGNLYIADAGNHRVRRVGLDGIITTFAGNGEDGWDGDRGDATAATLNLPVALAVDREGSIYIADADEGIVRVVRPDGKISLLAGSGPSGVLGDGGPATSADLEQPVGVAVDASGTVFVSDGVGRRVRSITPSGTITTVA